MIHVLTHKIKKVIADGNADISVDLGSKYLEEINSLIEDHEHLEALNEAREKLQPKRKWSVSFSVKKEGGNLDAIISLDGSLDSFMIAHPDHIINSIREVK